MCLAKLAPEGGDSLLCIPCSDLNCPVKKKKGLVKRALFYVADDDSDADEDEELMLAGAAAAPARRAPYTRQRSVPSPASPSASASANERRRSLEEKVGLMIVQAMQEPSTSRSAFKARLASVVRAAMPMIAE
jgi:hypothetical protein